MRQAIKLMMVPCKHGSMGQYRASTGPPVLALFWPIMACFGGSLQLLIEKNNEIAIVVCYFASVAAKRRRSF